MDSVEVLNLLKQTYPDAHCALTFSNPLELFIGVVLSAQCTDERVNKVTPQLFKVYKLPSDYSLLKPRQLASIIRSCGLNNSKSKTIINSCKVMVQHFNNKVPNTFEALVNLPGIGRKSANAIAANAFNIPGIAVDTHVKRTAFRMGLTKQKDPVKVELDLIKLFKKKEWGMLSHRLIAHGRATCKAIRPRCSTCVFLNHCPRNSVIRHD